MSTRCIVLMAGFVLGGCGNPLDRMARLSEVALDESPAAIEAVADPAEADPGTGFFDRILRRPDPTAAAGDTETGAPLALGKLTRVCGARTAALGQQVAAYPESRPRYRLYDSAPGSAGPHSFYLTGFDDGCARRFTAALAVFGPPEMHEQLRYGLPAAVQPYSATDKAYESVKSRVCGVARQKPCGTRIDRLARDTAFLSIYERFGTASRWANLLLHDGEVLAQDVKGGRSQ